MSDQKDKFKRSKRLSKEENAIKRQVDILKQYVDSNDPQLKQPHRLSKKHALNCGNPKCVLCSNPRKIFKDPTIQEKRFYQEIDKEQDKKSNGKKYQDDNDQ